MRDVRQEREACGAGAGVGRSPATRGHSQLSLLGAPPFVLRIFSLLILNRLDEAACGSGVCRVRAKFRFVIAISQQKVHRIEPVTGQWISEAIHARPLPS
jgi:hypothetical protein